MAFSRSSLKQRASQRTRLIILPRKVKHPTFYFSNNDVTLIRGGAEYFLRLEKLIDEAKFSLHFQTYIFDDDDTGKAISLALIRAAQRGVKVFVLLDGYASQGLSRRWTNRWIESGIYFKFFKPLFRGQSFYFGRRLHHKVVVADGLRSLVGGINISNRYNDLPGKPAWLDWAMYVEGEISLVLENICKKRMKWHRYRLASEEPISYRLKRELAPIRVRVNDWVSNKRQITRSYLEMFRMAQSHIIIMSPYFLPGTELKGRMRAAAKRGVKITLLLSGMSDVPLAKPAEKFIYAWLLRYNIEIFEYLPNVLHGKMATYDSAWLTIGSYNVNDLSAYASIELNLDVRSPAVAKEAEVQLRSIMSEDCRQITPETWTASATPLNKFYWWISYQLMRMLLFLTTFYMRQKE